MLTREERKDIFIAKANIIHNGRYDYSIVEYNGSHEKIAIICKEHGKFMQSPTNHLACKTCRECSNINKSLTSKQFIEKSILSHGNRYDYSNSKYKNSRTNVEIVCKIHGSFFQRPDIHIKGQGC